MKYASMAVMPFSYSVGDTKWWLTVFFVGNWYCVHSIWMCRLFRSHLWSSFNSCLHNVWCFQSNWLSGSTNRCTSGKAILMYHLVHFASSPSLLCQNWHWCWIYVDVFHRTARHCQKLSGRLPSNLLISSVLTPFCRSIGASPDFLLSDSRLQLGPLQIYAPLLSIKGLVARCSR